MKTHLKFILAAVIAVAFTLPTFAALDNPVNGFGVGTTNGATTLSWAIVPARSANNGAPAIQFISATSDLTTSKVQFYRTTAQTQARYATNSTVTLSVSQTNGFASGDVIVIRHAATENYEKRVLTTMTASTNLITTVAPLEAVVPGDIIYRVTTSGAGAVAVGNATVNLGNGGAIYVGQQGKPILCELTGTSTCTLNVVGGSFLP